MISKIIEYSIGSIFWGVLVASLLMALFFFLIKGWYKDATFKPVSYVIAVILGLLLTYNCTMICGAAAIKRDVNSVYSMLENALPQVFNSASEMVSEEDWEQVNELFDTVLAEHPILQYYVGGGQFYGMSVADLPQSICDTLNSFLNNVILKNVLWGLGFVIVCAFLVIKTMERGYRNQRRATAQARMGARTAGSRVGSRSDVSRTPSRTSGRVPSRRR